ncbi:MAG: winged helix-turn-helix domain-containing protein [Gammaproteobacteria bacterium]|nr:winged helix-turn-helix domain-containing protein [Gammaproteobacteria bacterium]MDH4255410.1 winged helix-turn-helix domain-containing protein [Gammaproteobacteria bacterium]
MLKFAAAAAMLLRRIPVFPSMQKYRFGDFELDIDALQLRSQGAPVRLERRPMDLLILLVRNHGRLVTREEIIAALWPTRVIIDFDSGLNTLVRKVRNALGDSPDEPRFVETVPGRGYRFVAEVTPAASPGTVAAAGAVPEPSPRRLRPSFAVLGLLVIALAGALIAWQLYREPAPARIAVLPFENLTGSDEFDYLASGLAEETSATLGHVDPENLRVIGVVSARAMAGSALPVGDVGRELGVDFIVLSSLRLDRPRVRVTSRLIRTADGEQVWAASFDRELTNVLGLQSELSVAIAEQVRQRLSPDVLEAIARRQTSSPAAYELYLKGIYHWAQLSPDSIRRGLEFFEQAVTEDPTYALAWAGIAQVLSSSTINADARPADVVPIARAALEQALRYGADLAEVQYAQGYINVFVDWDFHAAEQATRRAVELDPNSAIAHMLLGLVLAQSGNHVEAAAMLRRARELDPLFPLTFANSANAARQAGDPALALEYARQAVAIGPEFWVGYLHLGATLSAMGDYEAALEAFSAAERYSGGNSKTQSARALTLVRLGRQDEARVVLAKMAERRNARYVPPYAFAIVHAVLGENDLAFESLEQAFAERDVHLIGLADDGRLLSLHGDPRFDTLLERAKLAGDPTPRLPELPPAQ